MSVAKKKGRRIEKVTINSFNLSSEASKKGHITITGSHTSGIYSDLSSKDFVAEIDKEGHLKFYGPDQLRSQINKELIVKLDEADALFGKRDKINIDLMTKTVEQFKKNNNLLLSKEKKSSKPKLRFDDPDS